MKPKLKINGVKNCAISCRDRLFNLMKATAVVSQNSTDVSEDELKPMKESNLKRFSKLPAFSVKPVIAVVFQVRAS